MIYIQTALARWRIREVFLSSVSWVHTRNIGASPAQKTIYPAGSPLILPLISGKTLGSYLAPKICTDEKHAIGNPGLLRFQTGSSNWRRHWRARSTGRGIEQKRVEWTSGALGLPMAIYGLVVAQLEGAPQLSRAPDSKFLIWISRRGQPSLPSLQAR